jgi:REP element-mobilizing transposase RayT
MPQSFSRILVHLIFSTKNRIPFLVPEIRPELHLYLATGLNDIGCPSLRVGGVEDHVHLFFGFSRTLSVAKVVETVKTGSSKWLKTKGQELGSFPLADRIWSLFRQPIRCGRGHPVHRQPRGASPADILSGRIPQIFGALPDFLRRALCVGLKGPVQSPVERPRGPRSLSPAQRAGLGAASRSPVRHAGAASRSPVRHAGAGVTVTGPACGGRRHGHRSGMRGPARHDDRSRRRGTAAHPSETDLGGRPHPNPARWAGLRERGPPGRPPARPAVAVPYRCRHTGRRFSRKAARPSCMSAVGQSSSL